MFKEVKLRKRQLRRGEKHHWWPIALSQFWTDDDGYIQRLDTQGNATKSSPRKIGRISDAHNFYLEEPSSWDQTFEHLFDQPDHNFPNLIDWLYELVEEHKSSIGSQDLPTHFPHHCDSEKLQIMSDCLISLVVRSPNFRSGIAGLVQNISEGVGKAELKQLIALNLQESYQQLTKCHHGDGKTMVLFSSAQEFIFGDGFYNNLTGPSQSSVFSRILVPLTPELAVLSVYPMQYNPDPPLFTRKADSEVVALVNETVQVYSRDNLFFRSQKPELSDHFYKRQHLAYASGDPIKDLIANIPGVGFGARNLLF